MSYAPADWWPQARRRPVRWAASTHPWAAPPLGWILHVVVGDGSPWATFDRSTSPNRRFSHWWVAKSGDVEQYASASVTSWAQGAGNGAYWSIETEGMPTEALTDAQLDTLARLHRWLGVADQLAASPGQRGIGTHWMGGAAWGDGKTPHTCPDPREGLPGPRSHQRAEIIRRAQTGDDDMPTAEEIAAAVWGAPMPVAGQKVNAQTVLSRIYTDAPTAQENANATVAAILGHLPTGGVDVPALATALVAQLGPGLAAAVCTEMSTRLVR